MKKSYAERAKTFANPTAKRLLLLMDEKKTNLCVAADVVLKSDLLLIADVLGYNFHISHSKAHTSAA
jgi:hypothetical protein